MLYLFGFFGFFCGFYAGIMALKPVLRRYSNVELQSDKSLARKFGWIPWLFAFISSALTFYLYQWAML